jgi:tRNA-dihydrouridine synthase C
MLGRGALSAPDLAKRIHDNDASAKPMSWSLLVNEVLAQFISSDQSSPRHVGNRTKQWLAYLKRTYPQANQLFQRLRTLHDATAIEAAFAAHIQEDLK